VHLDLRGEKVVEVIDLYALVTHIYMQTNTMGRKGHGDRAYTGNF
jgi:hypothetical protein